jgi:hypothetical protein
MARYPGERALERNAGLDALALLARLRASFGDDSLQTLDQVYRARLAIELDRHAAVQNVRALRQH